MKIEALIALRYLFSRNRQKSVAGIISIISLVGLLVSTAALIIVLSVYNGIGEITKSLFNTFDPELVVLPAEGKTLRLAEDERELLMQHPDIVEISPIAAENAWLTYGSSQAIVELRGVSANYPLLTGIDTLVSEGEYRLRYDEGERYAIVVGGEIFYSLGMSLHSNQLAAVHIPKRGTSQMGLSLDEAFNIGYALPMGDFFIQQDIDSRYVVADIDFVRGLMHYDSNECTSIALALRPHASVQKVKKQLRESLPQYVVNDRYDQQPLYFKIYRTERLGIYLILSLIILISTLSLVASLTLLIINKKRDIFILKSMGMTARRIRGAFVAEGLLICMLAAIGGLLIGFIICLLQQQFGLIRMGDGNFVVSAFPIAMRVADFVITFLLVSLLSSISVMLTVKHAKI